MEDGLKQNLISERTFKINKRNLEKWVNSSYRKIDDNQRSKSQQPKSNTELIKESVEGMDRLNKVINIDAESARQHSHLSQSWRAPKGDTTS